MHYQFNEKSLMFGKNGHWGLFWKMDVPYQLAPSSIIWKILGPKISSRHFAMPQNYKRVWKQSWTQILLQWKGLMRVERRLGISLGNCWKIPVLGFIFPEPYDQIFTNQRSLWRLTWYIVQNSHNIFESLRWLYTFGGS